VRIIDYKTSKPKTLNQLLGKTKNSDKDELYQAMFYRLLSEEDPQFPWKIKEIVFDFISEDSGIFKKIVLPIDEQEYKNFKEIVKETYDKIKKQEFDPILNDDVCKKYNRTCEYLNICQNLDRKN
jgi:hypothetical protein